MARKHSRTMAAVPLCTQPCVVFHHQQSWDKLSRPIKNGFMIYSFWVSFSRLSFPLAAFTFAQRVALSILPQESGGQVVYALQLPKEEHVPTPHLCQVLDFNLLC